jgi:molybdopterin converting factor small subunit
MKVTLNYAAVLKLEKVNSGSTVDLSEGTTVSQLLSDCCIKEEHKRYILVFVDEKKRDLNYVLRDGEQLNLYMPIGGG